MKYKIVRMLVCTLVVSFAMAGVSLKAEAKISSNVVGEHFRMDIREENTELIPLTQGNLELLAQEIIKSRILEEEEMAEQMLEELAMEVAYLNLVIAQVNSYVNVRSLPSEAGEVVGKLYDDSVGTFLEEENGWYKIRSGNVTGYVKAEYCVTGQEAVKIAKQVRRQIATVTAQTLFVRREATTESAVIGMVPQADRLVVTDTADGWVKVEVENGDGWVSADYVTLQDEFVHAESKEEEAKRLAKEEEARRNAREAAKKTAQKKPSQGSSGNGSSGSSLNSGGQTNESVADMGRQVADYALQFLGNPYVYGGTSLTKGADCSGFVQSVYKNFGVSLPRTSGEQRSSGSAVNGLSEARAGDLVCYSGHIGIYIGDGKIVHASSAKTGIITSKADYRKILAIRRIF